MVGQSLDTVLGRGTYRLQINCSIHLNFCAMSFNLCRIPSREKSVYVCIVKCTIEKTACPIMYIQTFTYTHIHTHTHTFTHAHTHCRHVRNKRHTCTIGTRHESVRMTTKHESHTRGVRLDKSDSHTHTSDCLLQSEYNFCQSLLHLLHLCNLS